MPRRASIIGAVDPAAWTAAGHHPRLTPKLIDAGKERRRFVGIAHEIRNAAGRPDVKRARPPSAAVVRDVDAARGAVGEDSSENADDHGARIARIDGNLRNPPPPGQSRKAPRRAAVGRMPDAITGFDVVARI